MTKRRQYTDEFRLDAISLVVDQGYTRVEAARSFGIDAGIHAFRGNGKLSPDQQEVRALKAEVKRLKMERDILKKATAFFAAETT